MKRILYFSYRINKIISLITALSILISVIDLNGQFDERRPVKPVPKTEFLGMDYFKLGYTVNPGEKLDLLFRNNTPDEQEFAVSWTLCNYIGTKMAEGKTSLKLRPGSTGRVNITLPQDMPDGPYNILYTPEAPGWNGTHPFNFDYRKPAQDRLLNLNLVSFIENMDTEGWVRMMLGPLAKFCNVQNDFPEDESKIDAVIVAAEALDFFNPRFFKLQDYVREGGTMLVYGLTAPVLSAMLPVTGSSALPEKEMPLSLKTNEGGPWQEFNPGPEYMHYPLMVSAKSGSILLAQWSDDSPAVVSGKFGQGKVIYVSTGTLQVWQKNPALSGADEMALRLLYNEKGGADAVNAMLKYCENRYTDDQKKKITIRDRVFEGLKIKKPENFIAINKDNMGRFGWLVYEGGLSENIEEEGRVTAVRTQDVYVTLPDHTFDFYFTVADDPSHRYTDIRQTWFAKSFEREYSNGEKVTTTLSLGTPGILWEGLSKDVGITGSKFTHVAYPVKGGVKIIRKGETINGSDLAGNWLMTFMAMDSVRDMPQLIVLTKRPVSVKFEEGLNFSFPTGGFGAMFTSRLYGIKRLAQGATVKWVNTVPQSAINDAGKWSQAFLSFPVDCDEISWIENDAVKTLDRFHFKNFQTDWKTKPVTYTVVPPLYILAKNVGTPVELPAGLTDLNCPTKYGPLMGIRGSSTLITLPLPNTDHRAIVPADGQMVLADAINRNVTGIGLHMKTYVDQNVKSEQNGQFTADLIPYEVSRQVPNTEAPQIDLYKWWYTFNSILTRTVLKDSIRKEVDSHFTNRYWGTLNYQAHKSLLMQKREPWTGIEYHTTFIWPTNTEYGFRYVGDVQEAAAVNAYCYSSYGRYYGDWTTLRANWNLCRELHDFLMESMDWAALACGAREYWNATGIDMANSEPWGRFAFAYAAENAGYPEDVLKGKVGGARSLVTAVSRLGLESYLQSITSEGDPWREFKSFNYINEFGMQLVRRKMGGIGWLNSSKGAMHELALAYKMWSPKAMYDEQKAIEASGSYSFNDLMQRLFLGWDRDSLLKYAGRAGERGGRSGQQRPISWQSATDLYDMAVLCVGNIPVFLSDWAPAEYISGNYNPDNKVMNLALQSHLGEPFNVRIYTHYRPSEITVNNTSLKDPWKYDAKTGWLEFRLEGSDLKSIIIRLGEQAAPLHPYFSGIGK